MKDTQRQFPRISIFDIQYFLVTSERRTRVQDELLSMTYEAVYSDGSSKTFSGYGTSLINDREAFIDVINYYLNDKHAVSRKTFDTLWDKNIDITRPSFKLELAFELAKRVAQEAIELRDEYARVDNKANYDKKAAANKKPTIALLNSFCSDAEITENIEQVFLPQEEFLIKSTIHALSDSAMAELKTYYKAKEQGQEYILSDSTKAETGRLDIDKKFKTELEALIAKINKSSPHATRESLPQMVRRESGSLSIFSSLRKESTTEPKEFDRDDYKVPSPIMAR